MARNTAQQGASFERDVMHYLTGCLCETTCKTPKHVGWLGFGYDCMRSAASKGAIDVVAFSEMKPLKGFPLPGFLNSGPGPMLLIQCKITTPVIPPAERLRVQDLALRAGALPLVAYRAKGITTGRMRPHFRQLTGPGAGDWLPWEPGEDD